MIATAFGDLVLQTDEAIPGPVLSALMAEMRIRPEATRVALHRLRGEDWITSEKAGRTSLHRLTAKGRRESAAAAQRIYRAPDALPTAWQAVLLETSTAHTKAQMAALGFAPLAARLYVGAADRPCPKGSLPLAPGGVPPWVGTQFEPKDLAQGYADLHARLTAIHGMPLDPTDLPPLHVATLRCLIVHGWRRLVLRHPELPRSLYSADWRGHACRALALELLGRLERPDIGALQD
ncbi:MAG: PaaX family transcriptional regulator C-terminal domain-containing protein [Pseudomonadota bacterium]